MVLVTSYQLLKGLSAVYETVTWFCWGSKKSRVYCWCNECTWWRIRRMPNGCPNIGRQNYVCIILQRDTGSNWRHHLNWKATTHWLVTYLLTSSGTTCTSSSRQDSPVKETIAGRCMRVALSVHGVSNVPYTVFRVRKLLTHYIM